MNDMMEFEDFLKKYSKINNGFMKKYLKLPDYDIDYNVAASILEVKPPIMKRLLIKDYTINLDYTVEPNKQTGDFNILMKKDTFKLIAMSIENSVGEEARDYFIEVGNLVMRYHKYISKALMDKINSKI